MNVNHVRHWLRSRRFRRQMRDLNRFWWVLFMAGHPAAFHLGVAMDAMKMARAFGVDHVLNTCAPCQYGPHGGSLEDDKIRRSRFACGSWVRIR